MATRIEPGREAGVGGAGTRIDREEAIRRYYAGESVPCPVGCGGVAEAVRVSTTPAGGGEIWLECTACAQRERYEVPPATDLERRRVMQALAEGREVVCPRHAAVVGLRKRGRQLACPACGVVYGE